MTAIAVDLVDRIAPLVAAAVRRAAQRLPHLRYADLRLEIVEAKSAHAVNGEARLSSADAVGSFGVRVLAGDRAVAPGYVGRALGSADAGRVTELIDAALEQAWRRAMANADLKAEARGKFGPLGETLADTVLHGVPVRQDTVPATFRVDPRAVALDAIVRHTTDVAREVAAVRGIGWSRVAALTQLSRELFVSSEGAVIDQAFALTQGACSVVAGAGGEPLELWDVTGHQRGWEIALEGADEPPIRFPALRDFALALAAEARELAAAPRLPSSDREVVVVTDPHYNTLVAHEIVGHPTELDRALKMETAYAGRSWLLAGLDRHQLGQPVASPLVTAYSDPALPGYGHYTYDHEGTPARRVVHIERGLFRGFMNSRQTAALFGGEPNGHWKATAASFVPLVRMSTTVFAAGARPPEDILREVDRGWYVAGYHVPSIAESRENFRISARRVYEIERGELGRLYRDGGLVADTRDYLTNVDAVGNDLRVFPVPNCGKGQPMQVRRLGNGGPTMRSRARIAGG